MGGELGGLVSRQIIVVVVPYEVYIRTGSSWLVGLVGLVQVAPLVGFSFIGGVIADAFDRRLVLVIAEISMGLCCLGFAFNTGSRALWLIFALISVDAAMNGLENPAKSAVIPSLVGKNQLASAMSVHLSMNQMMQYWDRRPRESCWRILESVPRIWLPRPAPSRAQSP